MRFILAGFFFLLGFGSFAYAAEDETAFERVMRTQILRCGYGSWDPGVIRDPQTGQMTGLYVELIEEMARIAKIKVQWASEVDWGQISTGLQAGPSGRARSTRGSRARERSSRRSMVTNGRAGSHARVWLSRITTPSAAPWSTTWSQPR